MKQIKCRLCLSPLGDVVLNFGLTPLPNEYPEAPRSQDMFPLEVCRCTVCGHYQLNEQIDPERVFRHYLFVAGTSPVNVEHFRNYAVDMVNYHFMKPGAKVLDIASNDGTLLQHFKSLGMDVLGIDPAINLAEEATRNGIKTIPEFFTEESAIEIRKQYGQFDLITANNVFAHVPDMIGFTKGIKKILAPEGLYTFEVSYFGDVVSKMLFDTVYHEHTSYHTVKPLIEFFHNYGLQLYRADSIDTHGGSIRMFVAHNTWRQPSSSLYDSFRRLNKILEKEQSISTNVVQLQQNIQILSQTLKTKLISCKDQGKSIAIYGTPAKATTLSYALNLDPKMFDFAVDDAPLKQGRYTPGKHIPILHPNAIYERRPDVLLVLAWNFADSIIKKHSTFKGKWIVPIPELREYDG